MPKADQKAPNLKKNKAHLELSGLSAEAEVVSESRT